MSGPTTSAGAAATEAGGGSGSSLSPVRQRMVNIDLDSPLRSRGGGGGGGGGSSNSRGLGGSREVLLAGGQGSKGGKGAAAGSPGSDASADSASRPATPSPLRPTTGLGGGGGVGGGGGGFKSGSSGTIGSFRRRLSVGAGQASAATVALLAAIMGNVLEFYDFSVYAFFAPEIGELFFPPANASARAVRTFTVFAGGFLMRPIGSVLLGAIGDRYGTATALKWSILLMTVPTVATGCLPTYQKVGMAAPFLLTACRLLQGLSVGGELIGALLHTSDHSPPHRRGFLCGLVAVFGSMGNLLGSIVSVGMRHALTEEQLLSWGWRVPFLTGSLLGVVGVLLRTQTHGLDDPPANDSTLNGDEEEHLPLHAPPPHLQGGDDAPPSSVLLVVGEGVSPAVLEADRSRDYRARHGHGQGQGQRQHATFCSVMRAAAGADKLRFFQVAVLAALGNAHFYLHFVWLGTYLAELAPSPIPKSSAFSVTCVAQVCFILSNPFWGAVGDRFGGAEKRLRWNLVGVLLGCILPPVLFLLVQPARMPLDFAYAAAAGSLMGFVISGNYYAYVCEALHDAPARVMVTSVAYNLGAITGGAYPMLASALADFKEPTAPVLPMVVAAALGFAGIVWMQRRLDREQLQQQQQEEEATHHAKKSRSSDGLMMGGEEEEGVELRSGSGGKIGAARTPTTTRVAEA